MLKIQILKKSILNVSLLQLEQVSAKYRKQIFSKVWAILLLAIFVNALLIEALHHHEPEISYEKHSVQNALKQLSAAKVKCKLCEVLKHQSHFYDLQPAINVLSTSTKPKVKTAVYLLKHPVAYISSCANKGPPSLMV